MKFNHRKIAFSLAFITLPMLLIIFSGILTSSSTRVFYTSGTFGLGVLIGSIATSFFYAQYLQNRQKKIIITTIFGLVVPFIYLVTMTSSYDENPILFFIHLVTSLIGFIEVILYLLIFLIAFRITIKYLIHKITYLIRFLISIFS